MDANTSESPVGAQPRDDAGLRCPRCEYNLTGLPEPRCPECGQVFDWEHVRRAAANAPRIAFERARGWRKIPAFFATWATVLFAPWVFARQIVQRVSLIHALSFAIVCFAGTFSAMIVGPGLDFMTTWLLTAAIYIVLQAVLLTLVDASGWRRPLGSLRFWLLVGCYTSAVMLTEVLYGPPELMLSDLVDALSGRDLPRILRLSGRTWSAAVMWTQLLLWAAAVGCCYHARLRQRWSGIAMPLIATALVALALVLLYGAVVEHIGELIADHVRAW
jgi:hypothetical protein